MMVKGLEFTRVMVVLDDAEAQGFLFSPVWLQI